LYSGYRPRIGELERLSASGLAGRYWVTGLGDLLGDSPVFVRQKMLALWRALRIYRTGAALVWKNPAGLLPPLRLQIHPVMVM
jgi:hypothetical protein